MNKIKNFSFSYKLSYYNISTKWVLLIIPLLLLSFKTGDTKSEYTLSRAAYSVFSTDFNLNGFNDLIIGHKTAWGDSNITVTVLNNDQHGYFSIDTTLTFCGYHLISANIFLSTNSTNWMKFLIRNLGKITFSIQEDTNTLTHFH